MEFPIHHRLTGKERTVLFESYLVFPLMVFPGPFQLCFEEGHTQTARELRQTQFAQVSCLRVEMLED